MAKLFEEIDDKLRSFIEAQRPQIPGKYAIVLVTDGYPQGCDEASDTIDATTVAQMEDGPRGMQHRCTPG